MANQNYIHIEYDSLGIILLTNDAMTGSAAVTLLRADIDHVIRVVKLAEPRQVAHPVDRSDPVVGAAHRYRVDLKPATPIRGYADQLVKILDKKLHCLIELKPRI